MEAGRLLAVAQAEAGNTSVQERLDRLALLDLGQRDEAIQELERVVQSGPKVVDAYLTLGTAYLEAGRLDGALETLSQAALIDPARPDIRIQMARAYRSKGSLDKAEEQLGLATIEILWPSGIRQVLKDVAVNQILVIEEP
jgi:tetratricopeptide (TPR) repeat protein